MRRGGCLAAAMALGALALMTGLCSLGAFALSQQTVADLYAAGFRVDDPMLTLRCVAAGQCEGEGSAPPDQAPLLILTPAATVYARPLPSATQALPSVTPQPTVVIAATLKPSPTATASLPQPELPRITDPRALTILLMGIDQRSAADEQGPFRSDTMILLHVNPARQTVGVLSLPRDLWVEIPGYGQGRINTANFLGDSDAYPGGGGPALAMATIAANFGIPVENYLLVNFDVFTTIVDLLAPDGVMVHVQEFIDDPDYPDDHYGTIHVTFQPGMQRMDAERLLQYARTRATQGGDFDRARRQQQVLDALRAEVLSAGGIVNFVAQAYPLWQELQGNYRTNLELNELIALGRLMGGVKRDDIHFSVIDNFYAALGKSPQGDDVLIPDLMSIRDLIMRTFYPGEQLSDAEIKARAQQEAAPIYVYNGTPIVGLAGAMQDWLLARDVAVAGINNDVSSDRLLSEIRVYGRYQATASYLAQLLGLPAERIRRGGDGMIAEGLALALGLDAQALMDGN